MAAAQKESKMQQIEAMKHPHACDQCDATFWYPSHLKLHRKKHQKITIFECENCQKTFVKKKYYEKHIQSPCARTYFVPDRSQRVWTADLEPSLGGQRVQGKGTGNTSEADGLLSTQTSAPESLDQNSKSAQDASIPEIKQQISGVVVKIEVQEELLADAVSIVSGMEPNVKEEPLEDLLPCSAHSNSDAFENVQQNETIEANMEDEDNQSSRQSPGAWSDQDSIRVPSPKKPRYDRCDEDRNIDQLGELLKTWNLFDELYEFLKAKGLTVDGLRFMKERHIDEAFRGVKLNAKIIFEHKLSEWQNEQGIYYIRSRKEAEASKSFQASQPRTSSSLRTSISDSLAPTHDSESNPCPVSLSLCGILNQTPQGLRLLNVYAENQALMAYDRKALVHEVVEYLITKDLKMSEQLCCYLAQQIVAEFPTECIDTYFGQSSSRAGPKGMLWDRYKNKKTALRQLKTMEATYTSPSDVQTEEQQKNLDWQTAAEELKTNLPWSEVWLKWLLTMPYRTLQLSKTQLPLQKILNDWPLFKSQRSPELVDIDYNHLHSKHTFQPSKWEHFYNRSPQIFKERLKHSSIHSSILRWFLQNQHKLSEDNRHIYLMMLLQAVLPPTTVVVNHNQIPYSVKDSYQSFTRSVKDAGKLDSVVEKRKAQCLQSPMNSHPYMILLGELNGYREFYVVVDDGKIAFPTYLEALQHCFKLFCVLNLKFPNESHSVWVFVQKYLFGMNEDSMKNPVVDTLINDYNDCSAVD